MLFHIVLLAQVEELSDSGRTLGAESLGEDSDVVGQSRGFTVALLDNNEGEDGDVRAAMHSRTELRLRSPSRRVSIGEEEPDTQ